MSTTELIVMFNRRRQGQLNALQSAAWDEAAPTLMARLEAAARGGAQPRLEAAARGDAQPGSCGQQCIVRVYRLS